MDRRRAAAALLALAACFACSAAAPTSSDHTGLELYGGSTPKEGCYYNFQHYGEGDRIMTNEPCLNCTCHNRMLMCYLRVCPFTKAIGQDCTVEKRADQCCPIVTCPDVPVDLLTSTSTTSPAEYGGTGLGKVDNYGCSINGKYFAEGAKVPPTPNKPCEHCYCIRNMTTCVMQECTLHVDGCTPIYHKDVCCPVRYFCDHPEDEIPLLDDMTTTVRPTPGFLLTTTTDESVTQTQKKECVENDQLYPDGALIKTEKPCVHCYCMKGDIVCVVQECGTPMENEGKNCTSLPPREGQCCPDTYICEGDELTTEPAAETPYEQLTTLQPPRRSGVEGSGYRNEPDEIANTEIPSFVSEIEGSGEEPGTEKPMDSSELYTLEKEATEETTDDRFAPTEIIDQYSTSVTITPVSEDKEKATTEPDRGLNTIEEEISEPSILENTTPKEETKVTTPATVMEQDMVTTETSMEESSKPSILEETTIIDETKTTDRPLVSEPSIRERTTQKDEIEPTESTIISKEKTTPSDTTEGASSEPSISKLTTLSEDIQATVQPITDENTISDEKEQEAPDLSVIDKTTPRYEPTTDSKPETVSSTTESFSFESTKTPPRDETEVTAPTAASEQQTDFSQMAEDDDSLHSKKTTPSESIASTEPAMISGENTIPSDSEKEGSEPTMLDKTTPKYDMKPTIFSEYSTVPSETVEGEGTESSVLDMSTAKDETKLTESTVSDDKQPTIAKEDETITTEPTYRKEDEDKELTGTTAEKEVEKLTTAVTDFTKETVVTSEYATVTSVDTIASSTDYEHKQTTAQSPDQQVTEETSKESTTQSVFEVSDVTKPIEESATTYSVTGDVVFTSPADEKQELPVGTTINPEDNEIGEDISPILPPGRIPGEGDCLLNGITYRNGSSIPSNNKCHSGCKCVSSIVKCDPIICSPQPEYMDNCQPIYDTPDSCCPTYVCDHSRETIPPQPHSQMSGTESPQPSPSIDCDGDQCEVSEDKQHPTIPTELCTSGDCDDLIQKPIQPYPSVEHPEGCTDDKCMPTTDVLTPAQPVEVAQACESPENCKETHIPDIGTSPCEGESCITQDKPCEGQNCEIKPEVTPDKGVPQICESQDDCKEIKIPETAVSPCEGESCTGITNLPCDKESGCEEPVSKPCEGHNCEILPETTQKVTPQICENQDDCRETDIPETSVSSCEGESCTGIKNVPCDKESGCEEPVSKPCEGHNCEIQPGTTQKVTPQICDNQDDCKETDIPETAVSPCEGESCTGITNLPCDKDSGCKEPASKPCEGNNCEIQPETTQKVTPQICENQDDCKETDIPETVVSPCEGESCTEITNVPCAKESGCEEPVIKPCEGLNCDIQPGTTQKVTPQICENQDDCKETEEAVAPCEGESCTGGTKKPPQPSHDGEICSEEKGCKKPEDQLIEECADESCRRKQTSDLEHKLPSECKGPECLPKPVSPSQETTINVELGTELPITSEPISEAGELLTGQEHLGTKLPETFLTHGQETYTEMPSTTPSEENITIQPEQTKTDKPYKFSELPESTITEKEEASTRIPEEITTKIFEIAPEDHEHIDTEYKLPDTSTQESSPVTELPETIVTETKLDEEKTEPSEQIVTVKEEQVTDLPAISVTELSSDKDMSPKPAEEEKLSTESPQITESQESYTIKTEKTVTEYKETSTVSSTHTTEQDRLPEPYVTESEEITPAPEVSDVDHPEKTTGTTELFVTESERETSQISEITTKTPLMETEQEVKTEVQTIVTELPQTPVVSSEPEIEPTEPSVIEPHESSTDRPLISDSPDDSATKIQETSSTEFSIEQELSTKEPLLTETVSYDQHTELPETTAIDKEMQTELPTRRVTAPQELLTNVPYEDIDTQKSTETSELFSTEEAIETSTPPAVSDESQTKLPDTHETDETGVTTEEGNVPQTPVTQPQELSSISTEKSVKQQETYTELPELFTTGSQEYETRTPEVSINQEEKVQTDSPVSLVTELHQTPSSAPTSEQDETQTELPKESEPSILEEEIKTDIPESHTTEPEKMVTETPDQQMTAQQEGSKTSDEPESNITELVSVLPISTESPQSLLTGQDMGVGTLATEQQTTDESHVTEKEIRTESPIPSVTVYDGVTEESPPVTKKDKIDETTDSITTIKTESSYVPTNEESSSETPVSLFSEKEYTVKVTPTGESSVTEGTRTPEQPEEQEIHTEVPSVYVFTEQQELGTSGQDNIETDLSELGTEMPVTVSTETQEKGTIIPSQEETLETVTELPESFLTEEIPSSPGVEHHTFTTQKSSEIDDTKETTERVETIIPDQTLSTESPAVFITHEEPVTESESLVTTLEDEKKEITKSPEIFITEHEEMATTKSPVPNVTERDGIITKVPYYPESYTSETESSVSPVSEQELATISPEKEYTEPQEYEIKTDEPSVPVTQKSDVPPETEEMKTELPTAQETDAVPQVSDNEIHEPPTTEPSLITTISSKLHDAEEESHTELPVSSATESEEIGTKHPAIVVTEQQELDQKEPEPTEIVPMKSPELTELSTDISTVSPISEPTQEITKLFEEPEQTTMFSHEYSETTPYLVELEEHPHKVDEEMSTSLASEEPTTVHYDVHKIEEVTEASTEKLEEMYTESPIKDTQRPYDEKEEILPPIQETSRPEFNPTTSEETPQKSSEPIPVEEPSRPDSHLTTIPEETPEKSSEPTPVEEARPELNETTPALEKTPEKPSKPTPVEEPSSPAVYQTTSVSEYSTEKSSEPTEEPFRPDVHPTTITSEEIPEKSSESSSSAEESTSSKPSPPDSEEPDRRLDTETQTEIDSETSTPVQSFEEDKQTTPAISIETEKTSIPGEGSGAQPEKDHITSTSKPLEADVVFETTAPEEEFIPAKMTTAKVEEMDATQSPEMLDKFTKPEEKPSEVFPSTPTPETPKPGVNEIQPTDEVPSPEDEGHFPPSGGYGQEPDYVEEDQAFGPGTCRYGGKVYVSAQQIPRDDPCDFCFCFRSDIICLQQSCPPPIHGCHEEPIQGFCCPRYECPVSMATTLNVTTTTTTTTTTLPPHFLPHAYKGAAQRRGCQIKGHTYKVGEVVRASSGPCLHCTCGGDGQMKCDPKVCTPEPMLRQMIAAAVSSKRRR